MEPTGRAEGGMSLREVELKKNLLACRAAKKLFVDIGQPNLPGMAKR
jgi:hypothetical protein